MKTTLFTTSLLVAVFVAVPVATFSHGGTDTDTGFDAIRVLEDQALGDELHEEMEKLMGAMVSGSMSEIETQRMIALMNEYPGPHAMMMGRIIGMHYADNQLSRQSQSTMGDYRQMHWGVTGAWSWFFSLLLILWLVVGVFGIVWLWKQIVKNNLIEKLFHSC